MTKDDIVKLAIEHTVSGLKFDEDGLVRFAKLVAQQEQEPWKCVCGANLYIDENGKPRSKASQRTWVGLTDDEVYKIAFALEGEHWRKIADAIEAKLKEKNCG